MHLPTIYLHIGMPKAASSYLHSAIFPTLMPGQYLMPGARNAKKPSYQFRTNAYSVKRFSDAFHQPSGFWHEHGDEFLRMFLSPFLNGDQAPASVLISDEAITRLNHFNINRMPNAFERHDIENKLELFAKTARRLGYQRVKILMIIRKQDLLLASSYAQLSRKIVGASQKDFEKRVERLTEPRKNSNKLFFYSVDYKTVYQSLVNVLTEENVTFVPMEKITTDFKRFVTDINSFLDKKKSIRNFSDAPDNSRSAGNNSWKLRSLLLFKSHRKEVEITLPGYLSGRDKRISLSPALSTRIMSHYADSNKELANLLDVDLQKLGYFSRSLS